MKENKSNLLLWNADLVLGYAGIDAEHKEIFDLLKFLWSAEPPTKEEAWRSVSLYLADHLSREEDLMALYLNEQEIEAHRLDHHKLQDALLFERPHTQARLKMSEEDIEIFYRSHIIDFVQDSLIPHIHKFDALLANKIKVPK